MTTSGGFGASRGFSWPPLGDRLRLQRHDPSTRPPAVSSRSTRNRAWPGRPRRKGRTRTPGRAGLGWISTAGRGGACGL